MNAPPDPGKRNARAGAPGASGDAVQQTSRNGNTYRVVVRGSRRLEYGRYIDLAEALRIRDQLRRHGFDAHVIHDEQPEFGTSRRAFLIAMFMCNAVSGDRVSERILADLAANSDAS